MGPSVNSWKTSNDKPDATFGTPVVDNLSARSVISAIAPLAPRDYVVMEVKGNLIKAERAESLKRFKGPQFRRIAKVIMGGIFITSAGSSTIATSHHPSLL